MTTLTPRQLEILRLSAEGFSGPQIAVRLHVTVATVNEHRTRIRNRLGASTAAHAVAIAYQRGILQGFDGTDVLRQLDSARAWAVHLEQELESAKALVGTLARREIDMWARSVALSNLLRGMARRVGEKRRQCRGHIKCGWPHAGPCPGRHCPTREGSRSTSWSTGANGDAPRIREIS